MRFDIIDHLHLRLRRVDAILNKVGVTIDGVAGPARTLALRRRSSLRLTRFDIVHSIGMVARGMRLHGETLH